MNRSRASGTAVLTDPHKERTANKPGTRESYACIVRESNGLANGIMESKVNKISQRLESWMEGRIILLSQRNESITKCVVQLYVRARSCKNRICPPTRKGGRTKTCTTQCTSHTSKNDTRHVCVSARTSTAVSRTRMNCWLWNGVGN
jgi:hypothetical protein